MKTLVLVAHPNLSGSTVSKTWFNALSQNEKVVVRDLTKIGGPDMTFDPKAEQDFLKEAGRILLQFPFYWYSSPPVLKAWLDQVLLFGFAYGPGGDQLHGKELGLVISTGGPASSYATGSYNSFSMEEFLRPFEQTAKMVGLTYLPPLVLHNALSRDPAGLQNSIPELIAYATTKYPAATQAAE